MSPVSWGRGCPRGCRGHPWGEEGDRGGGSGAHRGQDLSQSTTLPGEGLESRGQPWSCPGDAQPHGCPLPWGRRRRVGSRGAQGPPGSWAHHVPLCTRGGSATANPRSHPGPTANLYSSGSRGKASSGAAGWAGTPPKSALLCPHPHHPPIPGAAPGRPHARLYPKPPRTRLCERPHPGCAGVPGLPARPGTGGTTAGLSWAQAAAVRDPAAGPSPCPHSPNCCPVPSRCLREAGGSRSRPLSLAVARWQWWRRGSGAPGGCQGCGCQEEHPEARGVCEDAPAWGGGGWRGGVRGSQGYPAGGRPPRLQWGLWAHLR